MKDKDLGKILRSEGFGDSFLEKNMLFDVDYSPVGQININRAVNYAQEKTEWYFNEFDKFYLLADCNKFHFIFMGHVLEYLVRDKEYESPIVGVAWGYWDKDKNIPHMWGFVVSAETQKPVYINWGEIIKNAVFTGKGSILL